MKVRALRGVCIGVERHLAAGDTADLEAAQVQFLASIGAVERVVEEPAPVAQEAAAAPSAGASEAATEPDPQPEPQPPAPAKAGKKEK